MSSNETETTDKKDSVATTEPKDETKTETNPLCAQCGKIGSKRCGLCRAVNYCSKECQHDHWPTHKLSCTTPEDSPAKSAEQPIQNSPPSPVNNQPQTLSVLLRIESNGRLESAQRVTLQSSMIVGTLMRELARRMGISSDLLSFWLEKKDSNGELGELKASQLTLAQAGFVGDQKLIIRIEDDSDDDSDDDPNFLRGEQAGAYEEDMPRMMGQRSPMSSISPDVIQLLKMSGGNPMMLQHLMGQMGHMGHMGHMGPQMPRQKTREELEEEELQKVIKLSLEEEQRRVEEAKQAEEKKAKLEQEQQEIQKFYETSIRTSQQDIPKKKVSLEDDFDLEAEEFDDEEEEDFIDSEEEAEDD